ncbi:MAG TPA: ABC transporter ATP-binding protein [Verrucomicrobiota bacterium]|nr:ABC transporter ATP-binding protein [Verrucomicrobiota bacterium]HNU50764.1 ABC transporter ATP-binding protein [Verrucomicrobiota bacterium]
MNISLKAVGKSFGPTPVLSDITLEIHDGEMFFLLGPSGCGKTTLLRLIAGFYQPDTGEIHFGDRRMNGVPPHHRNTGMVFQNYALWPHLTVADNVAYGLEVRKLPRTERERRVQRALETVQMADYRDRSPTQLSGGQQQRVALARALVVEPDVLLLDEPLSNLDAKLRLEMRDEIRQIHQQTRITSIYVTHDQKESLSLATRMAVMRDGRIEQVGSPRDIYRNPASRFVADFIGETNWLPGTVARQDPKALSVATACGPVQALPRPGLDNGQPVWIGFRPEAVSIGPAPVNCWNTRILQVTYLGEVEQYLLEAAPGLTFKAIEANPLEIRTRDAQLALHVTPENILVLPATPRPIEAMGSHLNG